MAELSLEEFADSIIPGVLKRPTPPVWPPDAFGLTCSILQKCGGYVLCAKFAETDDWSNEIRTVGLKWRNALEKKRPRVPAEVTQWWRNVRNFRATPILRLSRYPYLCKNLLAIVCAADEASAGFGIPHESQMDDLISESQVILYDRIRKKEASSLCKEIRTSRLCVLPKLHTPRTGMTIRSLTHHLALCRSGEIKPQWLNLDWVLNPGASERHNINLLLVPWPQLVRPSDFEVVSKFKRSGGPSWGYFNYKIRSGSKFPFAHLKRILRKANQLLGSIDGVIFPELSLNYGEQRKVFKEIGKICPSAFLISGVNWPAKDKDSLPSNSWSLITPILEIEVQEQKNRSALEVYQRKHHRWKLDWNQISQYGLGSSLDPRYNWWEHSGLDSRETWFFALYPWLTLCPLICEDLARQDPVSEIVRSVGPNLVVALLMDGPQLKERWPGKYATVLADDPGSSVLTLTSIGMAELCRPPGKPVSRSIALWKESKSGEVVEIALPPGHDGVAISITGRMLVERTADGRSDDGMTGYLHLAGVHPIKA